MHRAQVNAITRRAQIAGGVLLVACVGVAFVPGTWAVGRAALEPLQVPLPPPEPPQPPPPDLPDAALLASALNAAMPDMPRDAAPAGTEPGTPGGETPPPPPPPPPPAPAWKYVGAIIGPGVRKAIVSVDDKQHFAGVGEKVQSDEIVEVHPDRLLVRAAGVEREVMQAAKTDRPVSATFGGPGSAGPGTVPNSPGLPVPAGAPAPPGTGQPSASNPYGINPLTGRPNIIPGQAQPTGPNAKPGRAAPLNRLGRPAAGAAAPTTPPRVASSTRPPAAQTQTEIDEARLKALRERAARPTTDEDKQ